jgi:hypothetical protein
VTFISPDVTPFVDLRIYDKQPSDLLNRALVDAATKLPSWVPQEGNTEMVILEGQALETSEEVFAINRLPGAMTEVVLALNSIPRLQGAAPTATVTFTCMDTLGHTIPGGTNLRAPASITGSVDVFFTTDTSATAAPGSATTAAVGITGTSNTDAANAIPAGTALDILDPIFVANDCLLATPIGTGALPEAQLAYLSRGISILANLNSTLVSPAQFENYATSNGAFRAFVQNNFDATTGDSTTGVISVAVIGQNGALLTTGQKTAMQVAMTALAQANLTVRVVDPTVITQDVVVAVSAIPGTDPTALTAAIVAAVTGYLSTDTWPWSGTLHYDRLSDIIDNVAGVDFSSLTTPSANVTLSGFGPLLNTQATDVTVTVTVET